jgi:hypothetical protein
MACLLSSRAINAAWIVFGNGELEDLVQLMAVLAWLDGYGQ